MAWTATLRSVSVSELNVVAVVDFVSSPSGEKITRNVPGNDLTTYTLAVFCQHIIEQLEARDSGVSAFIPGAITLPRDAVTGIIKTSADADVAADDFFTKLAKLRALKVQIGAGIIDQADPSVAVARADVKAAFQPRFTSDPRFRD